MGEQAKTAKSIWADFDWELATLAIGTLVLSAVLLVGLLDVGSLPLTPEL